MRFDFTLSGGNVVERGGEVLSTSADSVRIGTGGGFASAFPRARVGGVEVGHKSMWRLGAFTGVSTGVFVLVGLSLPTGETCYDNPFGEPSCKSSEKSVWLFAAIGAALGVVLHVAEDNRWLTWEPAVLPGAVGSSFGVRIPLGG